jgi:hypothetical protein
MFIEDFHIFFDLIYNNIEYKSSFAIYRLKIKPHLSKREINTDNNKNLKNRN